MIYARRTFAVLSSGVNETRLAREERADEAERAAIDVAVSAWLGGEPPLRVREIGTNIAGTRRVRETKQSLDEQRKVSYRYEERAAEARDVLIGKICRENDDGFDHDPVTLEEFVPEVRLGFSDGSVAVMRFIEPEGGESKGDEGDGGKSGKRKGK